MAVRMQQRRATALQWLEADPILEPGEIGFETDTVAFKIGDGINTWSLLDYFETSTALQGTIDDYVPLTEKGAPLGVATLDANGFVPASQLDIDLSPYYTSTQVDTEISTAVSNLVAAAPGALDTLNELAAALGDDADFATTVTDAIAAKADASHTHLLADITDVTASVAEINVLAGITATTAELNYTDGVASNIQTQLDSKQATITGGATTITSSNLTASRALLSDGSGKVAVSAVTSTELGYLDGVTSALQTQLNSKEPIAKTVSNKTANYTIVAADENDIIRSTGGAITITIANVLAIGERIDFLQDGTGQITFAQGSGVTIRSKDTKRKTAGQYSGATIICVASGIYHLVGDLG